MFKRNSDPSKVCGLPSNYSAGGYVYSSKLHPPLPTLRCLSNTMRTHANDAVGGFTWDFPSSRFRMHREALSDHTADPSPLPDTLREQKVSTQRRVRICSQLGHEHGNCHCSRLQWTLERDKRAKSRSESAGHSGQWG